jgi:hypothetical protein
VRTALTNPHPWLIAVSLRAPAAPSLSGSLSPSSRDIVSISRTYLPRHRRSPLASACHATVGQAGYSSSLRLCWGLLAICSQAAPQDGVAAVRDALKSGAFIFLRQVFQHPHFKLDDQTHHHVVAATVHHIVHTLLRTDGERTANT